MYQYACRLWPVLCFFVSARAVSACQRLFMAAFCLYRASIESVVCFFWTKEFFSIFIANVYFVFQLLHYGDVAAGLFCRSGGIISVDRSLAESAHNDSTEFYRE